jgi:hypothetical protein
MLTGILNVTPTRSPTADAATAALSLSPPRPAPTASGRVHEVAVTLDALRVAAAWTRHERMATGH